MSSVIIKIVLLLFVVAECTALLNNNGQCDDSQFCACTVSFTISDGDDIYASRCPDWMKQPNGMVKSSLFASKRHENGDRTGIEACINDYSYNVPNIVAKQYNDGSWYLESFVVVGNNNQNVISNFTMEDQAPRCPLTSPDITDSPTSSPTIKVTNMELFPSNDSSDASRNYSGMEVFVVALTGIFLIML
jgi:hypothetical protein